MRLTEDLRRRVEAMGQEAYPNEGCGIFLGRLAPSPEVVEVLPGTNLRQDRARDRYILDPQDILRAERSGRARGLEIVGFWHTHPDHPARPSEYDANHAWPEYVYVIMAVAQGNVGDLTAWVLESEDPPRFRPEPITA